MYLTRFALAAALTAAMLLRAHAGDEILDTIDQGRQAYQAGDLSGAKQRLDLAAQLIGQKNAEALAKLLPRPLPGWRAKKAETQTTGSSLFGASAASRDYSDAKGGTVEVSITGDSAVIVQFGPMLTNPAFAAAMGKLIRIGKLHALENRQGDIMILVANKFLVNVRGTADPATKRAYAAAVDTATLAKM